MCFHGLVAHFFLLLNNISLYGYIGPFIHSPADGHLRCFQFWVIMNKSAVNLYVLILCGHDFSMQPRSAIVRCYGKTMFSFVRNCQAVSQVGYQQ